LEKVLEPAHAEVIACLQATQTAVELAIQNIILETDAAAVVQALMPTEMDRSSASGLLWELKDLLACNLVASNVAHNPRSCNLVAHSLAALEVQT
jgi:ribonuclease HI